MKGIFLGGLSKFEPDAALASRELKMIHRHQALPKLSLSLDKAQRRF